MQRLACQLLIYLQHTHKGAFACSFSFSPSYSFALHKVNFTGARSARLPLKCIRRHLWPVSVAAASSASLTLDCIRFKVDLSWPSSIDLFTDASKLASAYPCPACRWHLPHPRGSQSASKAARRQLVRQQNVQISNSFTDLPFTAAHQPYSPRLLHHSLNIHICTCVCVCVCITYIQIGHLLTLP